ncbi:MAG: hypothetical protein M3P29_02885 [Acidobacteriota bacterium]|nr:hypothetical protein [Acidobacteriota bacterium]
MTARRYGTLFILFHGAIALLHEIAHRLLPVQLPLVKYVIAYLFVGVLPLVSLVMLWTRWRRAGIWLLLLSMAGSLAFAGAHHFVMDNPDHVSLVVAGAWRPAFRLTAVLMAVTEAFGCWLALWLLMRSRTDDHGFDSP